MNHLEEIKKINVLIVDDHPIYRNGIMGIIKEIDIVDFCSEASNGKAAIEALEKRFYDIIFLDINMDEMDGIEASRIIKTRFQKCKIIVLTMSNSKREIVELLENGVHGYILKNTDAKELRRAIKLILEGNLYLTPEVKSIWAEYLVNKAVYEKFDSNNKIELTPRQIEIVFHLCEQRTALEIAEALFISEATVNNHRAQIMKKLNIKNGIGSALYAVKSGIYPI